MLLFTAGLLVYSQTLAFAYDEGFHLLTAQLIKAGKRPYLDFFFPQTPLNAYWNAFWFRLFGDTWRVAHAASSFLVAGAVMLTADYLYRRFPVSNWRVAAALTSICLVGLNEAVVQFGLVQAYGMCMFLIVVAFRCSILAVERRSPIAPFLAGLAAAAAANASLLSAPAAPVFLIWIWFYNVAGNRWAKVAAFVSGCALACLPLLLLLRQGPRQVLFNVFEYHAFHRQDKWDGAIAHDIDVYGAWIDSSQALILGLLAIVGFWFVMRRSGWDRARRAEFYLCAWLVIAITLHLLNAHPVFSRYWLLVVPYLSILALAGLYAIALRIGDALAERATLRPIVFVAALTILGSAKSIFDQRDAFFWRNAEEIAAKVGQVTPRGALLLATEHVYFILKRPPPPGLEHADSHKLKLPADLARSLHVIPQAELDKQIKAGAFDTLETCDSDEDRIKELRLNQTYGQTVNISDCDIFWDRKHK